MEDKSSSLVSNINPYEALQLVYDAQADSLTCNLPVPTIESSGDPNCKDIPLNIEKKTWVRIFRPTTITTPTTTSVTTATTTTNKLPIIIYFHGGGFILFSAASGMFHDFCKSMAAQVQALVVSVEYRLAPEKRLPAAYDDATDAINWVRNQAMDPVNGEPWLRDYADFSKCFLMGCSAGANISYHVGLKALELDLEPIKISGLILNQPFFGGSKRTESEIRLRDDQILSNPVIDLMWKLSLPIGVDQDHVYSNPMANNGGGNVKVIKRIFVNGCDGDPLFDRQVEFVKMLEEKGLKVEASMEEGGFHGMTFLDPKQTDFFCKKLKDFIFLSQVV